jgi:putative hydrolase of the HAD superfamily
MAIKNIIFDFGGVLYELDYLKSSIELAKLSSNPDILQSLTLNEFIDISSDFEKGLINSHQFRDLIKSLYCITADNQSFDKAWNSMLLGLKYESLSFLKQLKNKFRITLLSNSNQIHYEYFYHECEEMLNCFEKLFFSFHIGMRKPDKEIYEYVCQKMNYLPEETIFVDDGIRNIEGAELSNLKTYHFSSETTLSDLLHSIEKIAHI